MNLDEKRESIRSLNQLRKTKNRLGARIVAVSTLVGVSIGMDLSRIKSVAADSDIWPILVRFVRDSAPVPVVLGGIIGLLVYRYKRADAEYNDARIKMLRDNMIDMLNSNKKSR